MNNNKFNSLNHGFEPITIFPELGCILPIAEGNFIKIIAYSDYGGLVYWYMYISEPPYFQNDDRIEIQLGAFDFRKPRHYEFQDSPRQVYFGLITNDIFAKEIITHLLGTYENESYKDVAIQRYNENLGIKMRSEFSQYYI